MGHFTNAQGNRADLWAGAGAGLQCDAQSENKFQMELSYNFKNKVPKELGQTRETYVYTPRSWQSREACRGRQESPETRLAH